MVFIKFESWAFGWMREVGAVGICGRVGVLGRSNQRKNLEDGPGR